LISGTTLVLGEASVTRGPTTVLIADASPEVRDGLASILRGQPDFDVVGEASNADELVSQAEKFHPEILLIDARLPGLGDTIQRIKDQLPKMKVLLIAVHSQHIQAFPPSDIDGSLMKDTPRQALLRELRRLATLP